jgi:addiction module HigA family antidote
MSVAKKLRNIHPGEVLQEEFLIPLQITAYRLSKDTGIPQTRISEIVKGNRRITADTALRLSRYFGTSAKFWLGLQDDYDLEEGETFKEDELKNIRHYTSGVA